MPIIPHMPPPNPKSVSGPLLRWYDKHRRQLPWRAAPGKTADPYHVWLSEIMLQQTTVITVGPYYRSFLSRWPDVRALAVAELDDVLHAWQGLGYYARARNLHKCARLVANEYGGKFPNTEKGLRELPGIGAYTAAAVAAIAFGRPTVPVDGNIERVMARLHAVADPLPGSKGQLAELARCYGVKARPGDFAQALMDLGATICTPRNPTCALCPVGKYCDARSTGAPDDFPKRLPKGTKPTRKGIVYWVEDPSGRIFLRRRAEQGLLGGMMEFPSTAWGDQSPSFAAAKREAPVGQAWHRVPGIVEHTFTHFHLELSVIRGRGESRTEDNGVWIAVEEFKDLALPTLMKKVAGHVLDALN